MNNIIVVVGGGAAGMMAAGTAALNGNRVILLEKNSQLGKKIFISGKGRCNITNNCDIDTLIKNIPGNGNFLYSSFYKFSNADIIDFFNNLGLATKVERGERVFPESDKSSDVIKALEKHLKDNKVEIRLKSQVKSIQKIENKFRLIINDNEILDCDKLILCTGGISYPGTGSTGDGYKFAAQFGHKTTPLKPSLVPLVSNDDFIKELQGLSLKNVSISLLKNNKCLYNDFGEMLFTHYGLSGPIILSSSRHLVDTDFQNSRVKIIIDLKPALTFEKLDARIQRDFEKYSRKHFQNSLDELLPQKLIPAIIKLCNINPEKPVNQITKLEREKLVKVFKEFEVNIVNTRPITEAIVTCGGVATNEINPSTMESKLVKGLYFAGELIDVDAYTGGFNLSIAFSTGYAAGNSC